MVHYADTYHTAKTAPEFLASSCLLLASKRHDPVSLLNMVVFTDCSISLDKLKDMEMPFKSNARKLVQTLLFAHFTGP